jgi:hypothetical protein
VLLAQQGLPRHYSRLLETLSAESIKGGHTITSFAILKNAVAYKRFSQDAACPSEFPILFSANPLYISNAVRRVVAPRSSCESTDSKLCPMNEYFAKTRFPQFALVLIAAGALAGCGTYSEVREIRPVFRPMPAGTGTLVKAEAEIENGLRQDRRAPIAALDEYLAAAKTAEDELHRDPRDAAAKRDYNFAVSRIFEIIHNAKLDPWTKPVEVSGNYGDFVVIHKPDPRPEWNPALYDFTPADQFDVRGRYVTQHTVRAGIGAPIVAVERKINVMARANFAPSRVFYSVTGVSPLRRRALQTFV